MEEGICTLALDKVFFLLSRSLWGRLAQNAFATLRSRLLAVLTFILRRCFSACDRRGSAGERERETDERSGGRSADQAAQCDGPTKSEAAGQLNRARPTSLPPHGTRAHARARTTNQRGCLHPLLPTPKRRSFEAANGQQDGSNRSEAKSPWERICPLRSRKSTVKKGQTTTSSMACPACKVRPRHCPTISLPSNKTSSLDSVRPDRASLRPGPRSLAFQGLWLTPLAALLLLSGLSCRDATLPS